MSVWFLVWFLILFPWKRIIFASYEADFASTFGRRVRNTLEDIGPRYGVLVASDSSAANRWETTAGGGMFTTGVGGPMTGKGADLLVVDDPVKNAEEAESETYRKRNWEWWQSTARTRLEPGGAAVVVQTRWHEEDLYGKLKKDAIEGGEFWDELVLPAIAEDGDQLGRAIGDALWPERYAVAALEAIKRAVGSRVWAALYQQRPSPDEGGILKRAWFNKRWLVLPSDCEEVLQSWDCAFKDTDGSDYVVGQVWGRRKAERFLLDQVRDRMDFPTTLQAIRDLSARWPQAIAKLVEDKANGPAVIATLSQELIGLIPVNPEGGKLVRAAAISPLLEAGNVWFPPATVAPWMQELVEECATFPNGAHDDQVDAMSQALHRMNEPGFYFA